MTTTIGKPLQRFCYLAVALGIALLLASVPAQAYHYSWDQGHDTTDWNNPSPPGPCQGPTCDPCNSTRSPVYIPTGHFIWSDTDLVLPGRPRLGIIRTYNSHDPRDGLFGNSWSIGCDIGLYKVIDDNSTVKYVLRVANGKRYEYVQQADGSITPPAGRFERVEPQANGSVYLIALDGSRRVFRADGKLLAEVDPNGNTLNYTYDSNSLLTGLANGNGRSLNFTYNSGGRISHVTDHTGRTWAYDYDSNGNLISVTDPLGGRQQYAYAAYTPPGDGHTYYQLTQVTDPSGVVSTQVTYSGEQVASYTEAQNRYTYSYNTSTKTVIKTDSQNSRWTYVYNDQGLITRETDPLNNSVSYTYDANGRELSRTDELGKVWAISYDQLGRVTSKTNPLNETLKFDYTGTNPNPIRIVTPSGRVVQIIYDTQYNPVSVTDPLGAVSTLERNSQGDVITYIDSLGNRTRYTYNSAGRILSITDPIGHTISMRYNARGNMIERRNAAGEITGMQYDELDRIATVTDASGKTSSFTYDSAGRLLSVIDPTGHTTSFRFDGFGRLAERITPDGRSYQYSYLTNNRLARLNQPDGSARNFGYDLARQLTTDSVTGDQRNFSYSPRGELTQASNSSGTISFAYDNAGRLIRETNNGVTINFTLNTEGERVNLIALNWTTQYKFDSRGFVTQIENPSGTYAFGYDSVGRRTRLTLPDGGTIDYNYDGTGQVINLSHSGAFPANYSYSYDLAGRTVQQTGDGPDWNYQYDSLGRLISAIHGGDSFTYSHDAVGNVITNGRIYNPTSNRLIEDTSFLYSYDTNGNLTQKQHKTSGVRVSYTWNQRNELTQVTRFDGTSTSPVETLSFTYDPLGRRSSKTRNGLRERYVYDGWLIIGVLDNAGQIIKRFTFGPWLDEPLAASLGSNHIYYRVDRLGNVKALTSGGIAIAQYSYEPYGKTSVTGNDPGNPFRYISREQDAEDLYYFRARYYDPTMGRFLNEDPTGLSSGYNLYVYVKGNPVDLFDPDGLAGKGERGWSGKPSGSGNEFKKFRPHPTDPNKVIYKHPQTGKDVVKPKPEGFDEYWNKKHKPKPPQPEQCEPEPEPTPEPTPSPETEPSPGPAEEDSSSQFSSTDWGTIALIGLGVVVIIGIGVATGGFGLVGVGAAGSAGGGGIGGGLLLGGAAASDRLRKENFQKVDLQNILQQLANLPVSTWNYKGDPPSIRHLGPMAQDFYEAFKLGSDDKSISLVDANGVLVAAIQAIYQMCKERDEKIARLETELQCLYKDKTNPDIPKQELVSYRNIG